MVDVTRNRCAIFVRIRQVRYTTPRLIQVVNVSIVDIPSSHFLSPDHLSRIDCTHQHSAPRGILTLAVGSWQFRRP